MKVAVLTFDERKCYVCDMLARKTATFIDRAIGYNAHILYNLRQRLPPEGGTMDKLELTKELYRTLETNRSSAERRR